MAGGEMMEGEMAEGEMAEGETGEGETEEGESGDHEMEGRGGVARKTESKIGKTRKELNSAMSDLTQSIKDTQAEPLELVPGVTIPAGIMEFFEKNSKRFAIIGIALFDFPFELAFHFFKEIGHIIHITAAGFLWIALWMATEALATYGSESVLKTIFVVFNAVSSVLNIVIEALVFFLFGVIVEILQIAFCRFAPLKNMLSHKMSQVICHEIPGFGSKPIPKIDINKFAPEAWDELQRMRTTCAEFSNGPEVLQALIKLIFSPSLCPVVKHVRPVPWLHDGFKYTLGELTWEQGIRGTYEAPWAQMVTKQTETSGVKGTETCDPPPAALQCTLFGLGFVIVEILVPLIVVMMIMTPLKKIIKNSIAIAFSCLAQVMTFLVDFTEKLLSTAQWAGEGSAWMVIMAVPLAIGAPVGYASSGYLGLCVGSTAGAALGGYVAFERSGNFFSGPGPKKILIFWVTATLLFGAFSILLYIFVEKRRPLTA